ncbi:unnamed protein product [Leptosia nina]|uniref:Uncharacterized protein n=1 Tax=Leptosia nina TaxID=320188 RepID=A0AAV1JNB6_9NEOP
MYILGPPGSATDNCQITNQRQRTSHKMRNTNIVSFAPAAASPIPTTIGNDSTRHLMQKILVLKDLYSTSIEQFG